MTDQVSIDAGGQFSMIEGDVKAYQKSVREYRASLIGAAKYESRRMTANFSIRKQFNRYTNPEPQVGIGLNYNLVPDRLYLKSHFSTKYRLPTLNDKYWQPGGNIDLKPEHGSSGEIGLDYNGNPYRLFDLFRCEITLYTSKIYDLIEWVPAERNAHWHPVNTSKAGISGLEATMKMDLLLHQVDIGFRSAYHYARSVNLSKENPQIYRKQMPYTPYHMINNTLSAEWKGFSAESRINFTGMRYPNADNTGDLPPYHTLDLLLNKQLKRKDTNANIKFTILNILNRQYQVIAYQPMPGRAFYIHFSLQLNNMIL
jgi:iron complex outermembrane receptor protein